ncbi:hypothetical protein GDO81_013893 [Engystomops pustulosus]|uniref:Rho GTPase-activating protein 32 n=2 Tax=Engystomops pustulosus TaxID=76066 RepID=A0AAV7B6B8_ENGPU|nr:hypothetical protein GDO81_013893 [Engystomops pustulosus]
MARGADIPVPGEIPTAADLPMRSCSHTASMKVKNVKKISFTKGHFPKLAECAHFHYENVDFGSIQLTLTEEPSEQSRNGCESKELVFLVQVACQGRSWIVKRSYEDFRVLDKHLHLCIYDRRFSQLSELPRSDSVKDSPELVTQMLMAYLSRLSAIAGNKINCGPALTWMEIDNKGNHLLVHEESSINVPAIAAAHVIKRYNAQAADELSFEVGDIVSVIDMPPKELTTWWRGKHGFQVGFFPSECVELINDKVPQSMTNSVPKPVSPAHGMRPASWSYFPPLSRKHGKLITFLRTFMKSRPSKQKLKQRGILRERVFGCDLGEHLLNSGQDVPQVLRSCTEFIEKHGIVDGIYRLSGIASNIQKLRHEFDSEQIPDLTKDVYIQDIHCVGSLCKLYFRELPNPLLTYQLYEKFSDAVSAATDEERLVKIHDVIQQLPPPHYRTLEFLMRHLSRLATYCSITNMHTKNLAIVWAPNLLRSKQIESACFSGTAAFMEVRIQSVVVEFILNHVEVLFSPKLSSVIREGAGHTSLSRPKSLLVSSPSTKLLSLEEAQARTQAQINSPVVADSKYIEVGEGPAALQGKFHTVIDFPSERKRPPPKMKKSPVGSWRSFFNLGKSSSSSSSSSSAMSKRKLTRNPSEPSEMKAMALAGGRGDTGTMRSAKSEESLSSLHAADVESKLFRPRRPRSSSDALSASYNGDLLDSCNRCNSYDNLPHDQDSDVDEGLIHVPAMLSIRSQEDEDLSPPDIGVASLDFDPMSFQCSPPKQDSEGQDSHNPFLLCSSLSNSKERVLGGTQPTASGYSSEPMSPYQERITSPFLTPDRSPSAEKIPKAPSFAEKVVQAFSPKVGRKAIKSPPLTISEPVTVSLPSRVSDMMGSMPGNGGGVPTFAWCKDSDSGGGMGQTVTWSKDSVSSNGMAQTHAWLKDSSSGGGLAHTRAWSKDNDSDNGMAQTQAWSTDSISGGGAVQTHAWLKESDSGTGAAQTRTWLKESDSGTGAAQTWLKESDSGTGAAQTRTWLKESDSGGGATQTHAWLKESDSGIGAAQTPTWLKESDSGGGATQTHAWLNESDSGSGAAQAHTWLKESDSGAGATQTHAWLKESDLGSGAAQTHAWLKESNSGGGATQTHTWSKDNDSGSGMGLTKGWSLDISSGTGAAQSHAWCKDSDLGSGMAQTHVWSKDSSSGGGAPQTLVWCRDIGSRELVTIPAVTCRSVDICPGHFSSSTSTESPRTVDSAITSQWTSPVYVKDNSAENISPGIPHTVSNTELQFTDGCTQEFCTSHVAGSSQQEKTELSGIENLSVHCMSTPSGLSVVESPMDPVPVTSVSFIPPPPPPKNAARILALALAESAQQASSQKRPPYLQFMELPLPPPPEEEPPPDLPPHTASPPLMSAENSPILTTAAIPSTSSFSITTIQYSPVRSHTALPGDSPSAVTPGLSPSSQVPGSIPPEEPILPGPCEASSNYGAEVSTTPSPSDRPNPRPHFHQRSESFPSHPTHTTGPPAPPVRTMESRLATALHSNYNDAITASNYHTFLSTITLPSSLEDALPRHNYSAHVKPDNLMEQSGSYRHPYPSQPKTEEKLEIGDGYRHPYQPSTKSENTELAFRNTYPSQGEPENLNEAYETYVHPKPSVVPKSYKADSAPLHMPTQPYVSRCETPSSNATLYGTYINQAKHPGLQHSRARSRTDYMSSLSPNMRTYSEEAPPYPTIRRVQSLHMPMQPPPPPMRTVPISRTEVPPDDEPAYCPRPVYQYKSCQPFTSSSEYHVTQLQPYFENGRVHYRYSPFSGSTTYYSSDGTFYDMDPYSTLRLRQYHVYPSRDFASYTTRLQPKSTYRSQALAPYPRGSLREHNFISRDVPPALPSEHPRPLHISWDMEDMDRYRLQSLRRENRSRQRSKGPVMSQYDNVTPSLVEDMAGLDVIHLRSRSDPGKTPGLLSVAESKDVRYSGRTEADERLPHPPPSYGNGPQERPSLPQKQSGGTRNRILHDFTSEHRTLSQQDTGHRQSSDGRNGPTFTPGEYSSKTLPLPSEATYQSSNSKYNVNPQEPIRLNHKEMRVSEDKERSLARPSDSSSRDCYREDLGQFATAPPKPERSHSLRGHNAETVERDAAIFYPYQTLHGKLHSSISALSQYDNVSDYHSIPHHRSTSQSNPNAFPLPHGRAYATALGQGAFLAAELALQRPEAKVHAE